MRDISRRWVRVNNLYNESLQLFGVAKACKGLYLIELKSHWTSCLTILDPMGRGKIAIREAGSLMYLKHAYEEGKI